MSTILNYIFYFFVYSFMGWLLEVGVRFKEEKKFVNRGFLLGPICPIYGYAMVLLVLLIGTKDQDILSIFLKTVLVCSVVEYFTSLIMEKLFKARWWDYSNQKFNINGRICLKVMFEFGVMGTLALYFLQPNFSKFINLFSYNLKLIFVSIIFSIYALDTIVSLKVMKKIKVQIKNQNQDSTVAIKTQVTEWINEHSFIYKHIIKAFPKFKIIERVKSILPKKDVNKE